jgi:hypothetical protein
VYSQFSHLFNPFNNKQLVTYSYASEYQTAVNNSKMCSYTSVKDENVVCDVDVNSWGHCKPNGSSVGNVCMFFKINKVSSGSCKISQYKDTGMHFLISFMNHGLVILVHYLHIWLKCNKIRQFFRKVTFHTWILVCIPLFSWRYLPWQWQWFEGCLYNIL